MTNLRVGHGYDVHRLTEGRALILGGVEIPWEKGLLGHSDADVLTHAVMDALAGAARLGDIGKLFPDTDPRYKGVSSLKLLSEVGRMMNEKGWSVVNIDAVLLAQMPKIAPYKANMADNLAAALWIDPEQVNVKATTEEGLGFTGDGSGMAAHAVALVERRIRGCLESPSVRIVRQFFRQTRRFAAGILGGFQGKTTKYGGKDAVQAVRGGIPNSL